MKKPLVFSIPLDVLRKILFAEILSSGEARKIIENQLKAMIENGVLLPGARVKQQQIADIFNVSRMPVREALHRLEVQGYLTNAPHCGHVVAVSFAGSQNNSLSQALQPVVKLYQRLGSDQERLAFEHDVLTLLRTSV